MSRLNKEDMVGLLLTPLMSGQTSISERIRKSLRMVQRERDTLGYEDLLRMESVLYAFAMKFLSEMELNDMQEVFEMTILGHLIEDSRMEDLKTAAKDEGFREKLYIEYGIKARN